MKDFIRLIDELRKFENETPWVEFKHNNYNPETIGANISALANGAALHEKRSAYYVWGIDDKTHEVVGTTNDFLSLKKGNTELGLWLRTMLSKNADFEYHSVDYSGKKVGILFISPAEKQPVVFQKLAYIKIGTNTTKLHEFPEVEARLWDRLRNANFESRTAKFDLELHEVAQFLEISDYVVMRGLPQPADMEGIIHYLREEELVLRQDNGLFAITNLGALLLARNINEFSRISRKAVRVSQYADSSRLNMLKEHTGTKGYAADFERVMQYIDALLPSHEVIDGATRQTRSAYPRLAIREVVANALIHQDFSITGAGPTIEIFPNRIEITNPGIPLIDVRRFIDNPPKSRNEKLAALMRRFRLCEELGTGWDKIVLACEKALLPAPRIDVYEAGIKVTLFAEMPFSNISMEDRLQACYLHACIKYVQGEQLTNSSLRERFGLPASSSGTISRLIREAVSRGLIKALDPATAPKHMKYIPEWA